jgi:hypothetical protein
MRCQQSKGRQRSHTSIDLSDHPLLCGIEQSATFLVGSLKRCLCLLGNGMTQLLIRCGLGQNLGMKVVHHFHDFLVCIRIGGINRLIPFRFYSCQLHWEAY